MVHSPNIAHFFVTALQQRCSVVTNPDTGESVIIDGGGDFDRLVAWIDRGEGHPDHEIGEYSGERKVVALINTHAHFDHSGHIPFLKEHYSLEWWLHKDDFFLQSLAQESGKRWGFNLPEPAIAENSWEHGDKYTFAGMDFEIIKQMVPNKIQPLLISIETHNVDGTKSLDCDKISTFLYECNYKIYKRIGPTTLFKS